MIDKKDINIKRSCELLGVSRSSYYELKIRKNSKRKILKQKQIIKIREIWELSKRRYGAPKIKAELSKIGEIIGINKIQKLMREEGIRSIVSKKYKPQNKKRLEVKNLKNELNQEFQSLNYRKKIVGDITYIKTKDKGWCYLASYMDLYNNEIIGWEFSTSMNMEIVISALERIPKKELLGSVVHTDRGSQYTTENYRKKLRALGARESYSRKGNPYDNACIESFHSILKKEFIYNISLKNYNEMRLLLFEYIESWYNSKRIQKRLGYLSPKDYLIKTS